MRECAIRSDAGGGQDGDGNDSGPPLCSGCAGPSLATIFDEVLEKHSSPRHYQNWLRLFEQSCQREGWEQCSCECGYFEVAYSVIGRSAFCLTHGAESLACNISSFLTYFIPRKCGNFSSAEMKRVAAALGAVVRHCAAKGYCKKQPELLKEIKATCSFQAEELGKALQQLADHRYWDSLEQRQAGEEDDDGNLEDSSEDEGMEFTETDGHINIKAVSAHPSSPNGWELGGYGNDGYGSAGGVFSVFVSLPPEVASMGRPGASFSCMSLGLRRGVWRPVAPRYVDGNYVFANVYPPY